MADLNKILQTAREDDFVEYYIFPPIESCDEKEQERLLSSALIETNKIVKKYAESYLWHKDEFKLVPRTSIYNYLNHIDGEKENLPPHLYGVSHYGDNIEDEWFMVFLLQQLTKEIPGLIARVYDVDGEFLLIEAADYLPNWANPDTCENRVYICGGNIHLIPPKTNEDKEIGVTEALELIREQPLNSLASPEIQNSIKNKLNDYPEKAKHNLHRATVFVPVAVAAILQKKPNLVAPAVQAFCNRDPIDMRACRAMKYFPPENRVTTSVVFTKCLYAMLTHSKYVPDKRTGWNLPPSNSPEHKAHNLGVKIACGFEILASRAKPTADIETDPGWFRYLEVLKNKGYFKGLLEHSIDYNNLLNKAKEYYTDYRDTMYLSPVTGQEILDLTKTLNIEEFKNGEHDIAKDDDDSWLNISPEELDKMLQEQYGQKKIFNVNNNTDASIFTEKVTNFLNHVSDIDGAEFPDQGQSPIRPPRRKSKTKVSFSQDTKAEQKASLPNNKINLEPNSFACAVQNILQFMIPEDDSWDLESDSDMSEYEEDNYVKDETYQEAKNKMQKYMEEMDRELAATTIGESFQKQEGDSFEDIENFKPVDIDVNALKNILESYRSQLGEAGPSSNLLGPMGVHLDTKTSSNIDTE